MGLENERGKPDRQSKTIQYILLTSAVQALGEGERASFEREPHREGSCRNVGAVARQKQMFFFADYVFISALEREIGKNVGSDGRPRTDFLPLKDNQKQSRKIL